MTKVRRGNFIFMTWKGDHPPKHVHVFRDGNLIVKWNLDGWVPIEGRATRRILKYIEELRKEGSL